MRAIAMKCTQENWEEVKPILKKNKIKFKHLDSFDTCPYLITNLSNKDGIVSNVVRVDRESHNREVYEEWNKDIFLQACGISTKFKAGDKVRIISRKPANTTGRAPDCYEPNGYVGKECYIVKTVGAELELRENVYGKGEYYGLYSDKKHHFNDDDLELVNEFVLPEKWCVKTNKEAGDWLDINSDLPKNIRLRRGYASSSHNYLCFPSYINSHLHNNTPTGYIEITHEQFLKYVLKQETKMVQKLTLAQLKDLYGESSCGDWRNRIVAYINDNILAKDDSLITIKDEDITYARQNASAAQLMALKNAGIKFEEFKYKVGDYITVVKGAKHKVGEEGKTYKIINITDGCHSKFLYIGDDSCIDTSVVQVRPATEEEIAKASCPYKDGDLLVVRNTSEWELRYSNGTLRSDGRAVCYHNQQKSGPTSSWSNHKLANITLDA